MHAGSLLQMVVLLLSHPEKHLRRDTHPRAVKTESHLTGVKENGTYALAQPWCPTTGRGVCGVLCDSSARDKAWGSNTDDEQFRVTAHTRASQHAGH